MTDHAPGRRRRKIWPFVVLAFVLMPIVEIYLIVQVGRSIGVLPTLGLLVLTAILGALLLRREAGGAFAALRAALEQGRMPGKELADGVLIVIGGTLMLTPGFVTDSMALLLLLPVTRPLFRGALTRAVSARLTVGGVRGFGVPRTPPPTPPGPPRPPGQGPQGPQSPGGPVVQGEVVDDD